MRHLALINLLAILVSLTFISCSDECDKYPDDSPIDVEIINWLPDAPSFPSLFTSNNGNSASFAFTSSGGEQSYEDCSSKKYEWKMFEMDLDEGHRIRIDANNSTMEVAALLEDNDSYTYSAQLMSNSTVLRNGQLLESLSINGTTYSDLFLVTAHDSESVLDSIVFQNGTDFFSFKYKDETWRNDL